MPRDKEPEREETEEAEAPARKPIALVAIRGDVDRAVGDEIEDGLLVGLLEGVHYTLDPAHPRLRRTDLDGPSDVPKPVTLATATGPGRARVPIQGSKPYAVGDLVPAKELVGLTRGIHFD